MLRVSVSYSRIFLKRGNSWHNWKSHDQKAIVQIIITGGKNYNIKYRFKNSFKNSVVFRKKRDIIQTRLKKGKK